MAPGDVVVTNHPAFGGSHLPDITVVTPVFASGGEPLGYVASRAHHAEIGGVAPGSMPPHATSLAEEGVVIPPIYLVRQGMARWSEVRRLLEAPPYPSRAVEENLADLRAQVAAKRSARQHARPVPRRRVRRGNSSRSTPNSRDIGGWELFCTQAVRGGRHVFRGSVATRVCSMRPGPPRAGTGVHRWWDARRCLEHCRSWACCEHRGRRDRSTRDDEQRVAAGALVYEPREARVRV